MKDTDIIRHKHPKVLLRAMEPEDLDLLYQIENDEGLWDVGTTNVPYSRYTLHDYIATSQDDIYADRQVRLMAENEQGQVVGIADVVRFDPRHQRAELGIIILPTFRRQGYASAVVGEMARYSLRVLHLHQLYVVVGKSNHAAVSFFRETGFQQTAVLEHWLYDGADYHDALLMQRFL